MLNIYRSFIIQTNNKHVSFGKFNLRMGVPAVVVVLFTLVN